MGSKKITVGLLLDVDELPNWLYESIGLILKSDCASFNLLIYNDKSEASPLYAGIESNPEKSAYLLLEHLDEYLFRRKAQPNAFKKKISVTF